jgi:hypothetical protein
MNVKNSEFDEKNSQKKEYNEKYSESHEDDQKSNMLMNFIEYDNQNNELYYEEITINSEKKYETFAEFIEIEAFCIKCKTIFSFKNKLHKHLKENCKVVKSKKKDNEKSMKFIKIIVSKTFYASKSIIIKFTTFTMNKNYELTFRK